MKTALKLTLLILFAIHTPVFAVTYYVANGGNDSNPGTNALPFATVQKAATTAVAGDSIIVKPGTYAGARFSNSGTSASRITVTGQPGAIINAKGPNNSNNDNLWIRNASYITIEGFEIHSAIRAGIAVQGEPTAEVRGIIIRNNHSHNNGVWGIFTGYAEGIIIENNETSFSGDEHGIYVSNSSDNPVIAGNKAHHNNASGIQINADPLLPGDGIISNALIDSNIIYENGTAGGAAINLASVTFSTIRNNLLYKNNAGGIAGWDDGEGSNQFGTHHNKFFNNTIIQPSNGRFVISFLNGSTNNQVKNNILLHLGTRGSINVDSTSEPGLDSDYNAVVNVFSFNDGDTFVNLTTWRSRGHDLHSFVSNSTALFVNPAADDYHLKTGSPAINTGTALGSDVPDDLEGVIRPQGGAFDIGAYETSAGGCTDTLPPSTAITAPSNGATISGNVTVNATGTDDCSINRVEFFAGSNLIGTDTSSPYSITWDTKTVVNGSHQLTSRAFDNAGKSTTSSPVSVTVNNVSTFSDDFEDGNASGWTFTAGTWSVINGDLTGTAKTGDALSPNFGGCTVCTIESDVRILTASGRASIYGWRINNNTFVELMIQDDKNRYILRQLSGGTNVAQVTASRAIATNTYYNIRMSFNGSNFQVFVDNTLIITMNPAVTPSGNVGFRIWSPNNKVKSASFRGIVVN